jgi:ribosomal protein L16/L10AE
MKDNHKKSKNIHTMLTSSIALISNALSNKPDFFIAEQMKKLEETERARQEALEAADAARKELEGEGKFYVTFCLL